MGEKLAREDEGKHHTHDEMFRFLAIVNDHLYQRDWLVEHTEEINQTVRRAIHQPPIYHYAVTTLTNVIPVMLTQADFKTWGHHLIDSLVYAQEIRDHDLIAKLMLAVARYKSMIGSASAAEVMASRAQEYISNEDTDIHVEAYAALIEAYLTHPKKDFKPEILEEALAVSEQSHDDALKASIRQVLSVAYLHKVDYAKAELHAQKALEIAKKMRDVAAIFRAVLVNASVQRHLSNWDAVAANVREAWSLWEQEQSAAPYKTQRNYLLLCYEEANMYRETGQPEKSVETYQKGLRYVEDNRGPTDTYEIGLCRTGLTYAYVTLGCFDNARDNLRETKSIWSSIGSHYMIAHTIYMEAYVDQKSGEPSAVVLSKYEQALVATANIPDDAKRESLAESIRAAIKEFLSDN